MTLARPASHAASLDPRLHARIVGRTPLRFDAGADATADRPAHVRAASGLAWLGDELAIVQDDLAFLAICRLSAEPGEATSVRAVPLPRGPGGRRRFEERLGNKLDKPDLESCFAVDGPHGPRVLGFGSGPFAARRRVAILDASSEEARLVAADALYVKLREALAIPDAQVNLEGAFTAEGRACFLQRGSRTQPSALVAVSLADLVAWLEGGAEGRAPDVLEVVRYDLGAVDGVSFGFTDGAALPDGRAIVLAAAEDTDDPIHDGAVLGMRLGVLDGGEVRLTELLDESGAPAALKAEGVAIDRGRAGRLWLVTDADDVDRPAELVEVAWSE